MTFKPNADCFRVGKKFFIYKLNEFWELIYYHDYSAAGVWKDEEEALYSKKADKYSILSLIDSRYKTNDEYEFLLEYPGYSGYNRWCQKLNPLEENEVNVKYGQTAEGFRGISLSWTDNCFGGLVRSSSTYTLLDGSTHYADYWWYAIGAYISFTVKKYTGVPGPNSVIVAKTALWIKTKNPFLLFCYNTMNRSIYSNNLIMTIFVILLECLS